MEFVYVVELHNLFTGLRKPIITPYGFLTLSDFRGDTIPYVSRISEHGFFMEREYAENHSDFKQIIPYSLVVKFDEDRDICIFCYHSLKGGGEKRLHGLDSIGVGGHINPVDRDLLAGDLGIIFEGALREVDEELLVEDNFKVYKGPIGIINDDTNPVGSVHFGVVTVVWVRDAKVREEDSLKGNFVKFKNLNPSVPFESWSQFIVERKDEVIELLESILK